MIKVKWRFYKTYIDKMDEGEWNEKEFKDLEEAKRFFAIIGAETDKKVQWHEVDG